MQKLFGYFPKRWPKMNTQRARENWEVRYIYKTFICLETIINKFERLSHSLMQNEIDAGMSDK